MRTEKIQHWRHSAVPFLIASSAIVFTVMLWSSITIVISDINKNSAKESRANVESRIGSIHGQINVIASDYNNWDNVYLAAMTGDIEFISENYGITAARGDVFEYALLFAGPFPHPNAWVSGKGYQPIPSFLPNESLIAVREISKRLPVGSRETFEFSEFVDGKLVMFSAAQLLPEELSLLGEKSEDDFATAIVGKILTNEKIASVQRELGLKSLKITNVTPPTDSLYMSVNGYDGQPRAYIEWEPPMPGSALKDRLLPILISANALVVLVLFATAHQTRASTKRLLEKEAEAALLARTDSLSGLPNRFALSEHIKNLNSASEFKVAALQVDIDNFKHINDLFGHAEGDKYIKAFSKRLSTLIDDNTFVARVGGDEFTIVVTAPSNQSNFCCDIVSNLKEVFRDPINIQGNQLDVSASVGIAACGQETTDLFDLALRADKAMYSTKRRRKGGISFYDKSMEVADLARGKIEFAMRAALANRSEFWVSYQPIVSCINPNSVFRYEALARWDSSKLGAVPPSDFIMVAEETGLIVPLGWLIIDLIAQDMSRRPQMSVGINISPLQLMSPGFADEIGRRLALHGVSCSRVDLELTENLAFSEEVLGEIFRLKELGFTISLDDFGTGFSSIGYVRSIPFDVIKIDRSFVSGGKLSENRAAVSAIVMLVKSLGRTVIAEGVEEPEQLLWLQSIDCDGAQGYLIGKPVLLDDLAFGEFSKRTGTCTSASCISPNSVLHIA